MLIIAFGDVHMSPERARQIPEIREADCVVVNGDLTICGGRGEARTVLDAVSGLNPEVYALFGNMDLGEVDGLFTEMGINLHRRGVRLGEVGLFGVGGSTPTPFGTPSEFSEEEMEAWLWQGYQAVRDAPAKILFSHTPPLDTRLDRIRTGRHVGSSAVRAFLEKTDCAVCVCGHIHEAVGTDRLGSAILVNPGMLRDGGYARIEHADGKTSATYERC